MRSLPLQASIPQLLSEIATVEVKNAIAQPHKRRLIPPTSLTYCDSNSLLKILRVA